MNDLNLKEKHKKQHLARKDKQWYKDYQKRSNDKRRGKRPDYSSEYKSRDFDHYLRSCLNHAKTHSMKVNREFNIDIEFLLNLLTIQEYKCAISGIKMTHNIKDLRSVSIDRIDSSKGYIPENVQLVCKTMNIAKNTHSNAEILGFIREIRLDLLIRLKSKGLLIAGDN